MQSAEPQWGGGGGGTSRQHRGGKGKRRQWNPFKPRGGGNFSGGGSRGPRGAPCAPRAMSGKLARPSSFQTPSRPPADHQEQSHDRVRDPFDVANASPRQPKPRSPRPLPADHPLMIEMAELTVTRERRRLYWAGLANELDEEWRNPAGLDRQNWQEEERLADKKYAELAGQIMLAERSLPIIGASQVSDIGQHDPNLGNPFDDKKADRGSRDGKPYRSYVKPRETVVWSDEKKLSAVDKWMEDMGATAPLARVESLFIGDSDSSNGAMSPKHVEEWIDQGIVGSEIGPHHSLEPNSFLLGGYSTKPLVPEHHIESFIDNGVKRIWTSEDEAAYEEAEAERELQRLEAGASSNRTADDIATSEEAETEREEQRLHVGFDQGTVSDRTILLATNSQSTRQDTAHDNESPHKHCATSLSTVMRAEIDLVDESTPGSHFELALIPSTERPFIEQPSNLDYVNCQHIPGPTNIMPAGPAQNAKAPSSIPSDTKPEGTQAGRDMFAALLEELDRSDSSDSELEPEPESEQQSLMPLVTQHDMFLAEQQALAIAAFRGLQEQGLIGRSESAGLADATNTELQPNSTSTNGVPPMVKDPGTDLELQRSRFEGMTVATDEISKTSTESVSERAEWMDIDDAAVEVVNLQNAAESDSELESSDYTIHEPATDAMKFYRPRVKPAAMQSIQRSSAPGIRSKTAESAKLDPGSNDDGYPCESESGSDDTIGYERVPEVRRGQRSTSAFERSKSTSAMSKQRRLSKIWTLENKLRKIGKYKARRDAGKEIPFAHTRMINREEDFTLDLEVLRAWGNSG
ncbi:MAG: hypothetical protein Q9187_004663 [Circinaria calcarea]